MCSYTIEKQRCRDRVINDFLSRSCTPQGPMEARGENINVSSGPSKEIAGLKKMKMMTQG